MLAPAQIKQISEVATNVEQNGGAVIGSWLVHAKANAMMFGLFGGDLHTTLLLKSVHAA